MILYKNYIEFNRKHMEIFVKSVWKIICQGGCRIHMYKNLLER